MNQRPSGYEPDELPDCSTPRYLFSPHLEYLFIINDSVQKCKPFFIQILTMFCMDILLVLGTITIFAGCTPFIGLFFYYNTFTIEIVMIIKNSRKPDALG